MPACVAAFTEAAGSFGLNRGSHHLSGQGGETNSISNLISNSHPKLGRFHSALD
jgi:hypothetical protein